MHYVTPEVVDLGTLVELTAAITVLGPEDGASKNIDQHHLPGVPMFSDPAAP